MFTPTVAERESFHTKIDLEKAKLAREYQEILMYPSSSDMKKILSRNLVKNAKVTVDDIKKNLEVQIGCQK